MRRVLMAGCLLLLYAGGLQAGLYNPAEPDEAPVGPIAGKEKVEALPFGRFRQDFLSDLIGIGVPKPESPKRRHYLKRRDELQAKGASGRLSLEEQVTLSAYLIRLKQYDEAVTLLSRGDALASSNFMALANLATAYQQASQPDRALFCLQRLKRKWPDTFPGLTKEQLDWYRQAEEYHWQLLRLRNGEMQRQQPGGAKPPEHVDNLFGPPDAPLRFVGDSGKYEAGRLAAEERKKLPDKALAIVEQLLLWLPEDTRLYWLLGELLNARGKTAEAAAVFDDCIWNRGLIAEELKEHRAILKESGTQAEEQTPIEAEPAPDKEPASWRPQGPQLIVVGGIAGLLIAILVLLQVRELRRRRAARSAARVTSPRQQG